MQKGVQPTSIRSQLYAFLLFIRILSFTYYSMPCLLVYVINTISETIATYTRPRHTLQKSFVKLFPQTVFSNKLYCLGEITFDRHIILFRHITKVMSELNGIFHIRQHQFCKSIGRWLEFLKISNSFSAYR